MSEREKEREREKRKESKRGRGGRERREMSVHYSCLFCTYMDQAYKMGLTTENHVWMFPAWYRPDWYKEDYKLPNNNTVLCTKAEVCT